MKVANFIVLRATLQKNLATSIICIKGQQVKPILACCPQK